MDPLVAHKVNAAWSAEPVTTEPWATEPVKLGHRQLDNGELN